ERQRHQHGAHGPRAGRRRERHGSTSLSGRASDSLKELAPKVSTVARVRGVVNRRRGRGAVAAGGGYGWMGRPKACVVAMPPGAHGSANTPWIQDSKPTSTWSRGMLTGSSTYPDPSVVHGMTAASELGSTQISPWCKCAGVVRAPKATSRPPSATFGAAPPA